MQLSPARAADSLRAANAADHTATARLSVSRYADRILDGGVALIVALAFCLPMLTSRSGYFIDWQNHLHLVATQASYVRQHLLPTYFLNTVELGWFYPMYAFYGGSLYYLVALPAALFNSPLKAYLGSYALAVVAAFGGWTWLARQAGLRGWPGYLPGCVFVCGAYYVTDAYGRGAWPEFVAVSMVPLVLASAWSLLTSRVKTPTATVALLGSAAVLAGSHAITLAFGTVFLAGTIVAGLLVLRPGAAAYRRIPWLLGIGALALGLNAWYLVPLLGYKDTVRVAPLPLQYPEFNANEVLFSLFPTNPWSNSTPQLYVQAPIVPLLAAFFVLLVGMIFVRSWRLFFSAVCALLGLCAVLVMMQNDFNVWNKLPEQALFIQFTYRLNSYFLACIAATMLLACLCAVRLRTARPWLGASLLGLLGAATLVQVGFAESQVWSAKTYAPDQAVLEHLNHLPGTWYDRNYLSSAVPVLPSQVPARPWIKAAGPLDDVSPMCDSAPLEPGTECWAATEPARFDVSSIRVLIPPRASAEQIKTNIVPSPLIAFDPPLVGQADSYAVVSVPASDTPTTLFVHPAWQKETVLGVALSVASLVVLSGLLGFVAVRRLRAPRGT